MRRGLDGRNRLKASLERFQQIQYPRFTWLLHGRYLLAFLLVLVELFDIGSVAVLKLPWLKRLLQMRDQKLRASSSSLAEYFVVGASRRLDLCNSSRPVPTQTSRRCSRNDASPAF